MDLAELAQACPAAIGVYRLYHGARLLHIGMAAGAATVRSEVLCHARGDYGASTQHADRVEYEVACDALFAYKRFLALYEAASHERHRTESDAPPPSASRRHSGGL